MNDTWTFLASNRVLVTVLGAVLLGVSIVHFGSLFALTLPVILGGLLLLALVRGLHGSGDDLTRRRILRWTLASFVAHLAFGLVVQNSGYETRYYLAADSITYHNTAAALVEHWKSGTPMPFLPGGKEGYYYLLAGLYWLFGAHATAGLAVNAILAAALVPITSDTTRRLFGSAAAPYAGLLVVLLPGMFLWTSALLKEAAMLFLLAVALNCAVRLGNRMSPGPLIILTVSLVFTLTIRAWVGLVVAAGILIALAVSSRHLLSGLGNTLSSLVVVGVVMIGSGVGYSGYQVAVKSDLKQAQAVRADLAYSAATAYDPEADVSTTGAAVAYLPRGIASFLFGPMPWNVQNVRQLPFVPDMLVWWFLLPSLWLGIRTARSRIGRRVFLMILPALATTVLMSLALGNFGTVVRERLQVQVLVAPLIAVGLAERARRRAEDDAPAASPAEQMAGAAVIG